MGQLLEDSGTSLAELVGVAAQLIADAGLTESRAVGSTDPLDRRTYVRTLFALIEGVSFCQGSHAKTDILLTAAQRERARVAAALAWKAGQRAGEKVKACLRVRAAFAAVAEAHDFVDPLDTQGVAWQRFKEAAEVRNPRWTPKTGH